MPFGILPKNIVLALSQAQVEDMLSLVSFGFQKLGHRRRQLCIDKEPHTVGFLDRLQDGVIDLRSGKLQTGPDVLGFEEWIILKNFRIGHAGPKQFEHIIDPQTIVANAGTSSALLRIKGDSVKIAHKITLAVNGKQRESVFRASIIWLSCERPNYIYQPSTTKLRVSSFLSGPPESGLNQSSNRAAYGFPGPPGDILICVALRKSSCASDDHPIRSLESR